MCGLLALSVLRPISAFAVFRHLKATSHALSIQPNHPASLIEINAVLRSSDYIGSSNPQPIATVPCRISPAHRRRLANIPSLFSNRKWIGRPQDEYKPNKMAIPRIVQSADIQRTIPLEPETSRRGDVTLGGLELVNTDGGLDDLISNYSIADRPISIYYGLRMATSKPSS